MEGVRNMTIETKGWVAQMDNMPGSVSFRVYGSVVVAHPGLNPTLSVRDIQDKSFALALELKLEAVEGIYPQVVTEKTVSFKMPGDHSNIPKVDIFYQGQLIHSITDILVTH
jgi:hypothetical protein